MKKKIFFCEKNFSGGGRLTLSKKNFSGLRPEKFFFGYTWIHLDTPGNCQVLPDTPERPEKCPRVWFLGPGVSRSFQVGGNCEKKISGGGLDTPGITLPARMPVNGNFEKELKMISFLCLLCPFLKLR